MGLLMRNGVAYAGSNSIELTQAEYNALAQLGQVQPDTFYCIVDADNVLPASDVTYDNSDSGLVATNTQEAINEVDDKINDVETTINNLTTLSGATATITSSYVTSGYIYAWTKGNVLIIKLNGVKFSTFSGRITIANLPVGYRPPFECTSHLDASTTVFGANGNGDIWVDAGASGKQVWATLTTIAG